MKIHNICFDSFIKHGNIDLSIINNELNMTAKTGRDYPSRPIKTYLQLPDKYKLPFRIDATVKIDSPAFHLLIGKGHVSFATGIMDNRRITDILGEDNKPNTHVFDNDILLNEYNEISVTYSKTAMWVFVNNILRCFSKNDQYIKSLKKNLLPDEFMEGFTLGISCDKRTQLTLKSFRVTEFENEEPAAPAEAFNKKLHPPCLSVSDKPIINDCIQGLSPDLQKEILLTDEYLLKDMKNGMKFKRKIEGGYPCSRITYVSHFGFSYKISISDSYIISHDMGWIVYNTNREREKYGLRKNDYTQETIDKLNEISPEFANEVFIRISECTACSGANCGRGKIYEYNGKKKKSCGSRIYFKMFPSDFIDVRKIIEVINNIVGQPLDLKL